MRAVLGSAVRRLREAEGLRQDDLARCANELGLAWPRSKIAALERGDKAVSAEELVLLVLILRRAFDREVSMTELFEGNEQIQLTGAVTGVAREVGEILGGADAGSRLRVRLPLPNHPEADASLSLDDAEG